MRQRQTAGELGFVYGAFNGTWARASYPGDPWQPVDDGFAPIGGWITSDEAAADEMIEWVAEWADYLGGLDELRPYGVELIRTALGQGISAEALAAFFSPFRIDPRSPLQPDIAAGVVAAEDFTRNFAVPASFADDPDTAEVSVVEDVVIGAPDSRPSSSSPPPPRRRPRRSRQTTRSRTSFRPASAHSRASRSMTRRTMTRLTTRPPPSRSTA